MQNKLKETVHPELVLLSSEQNRTTACSTKQQMRLSVRSSRSADLLAVDYKSVSQQRQALSDKQANRQTTKYA